ncbi:MAG: hypothetical protein UY92_C0003G0053 [Candidatus Magasanikbacteria bacterium GW2011_GWA2_56_11]|uniref:HlyC/CorC family transporter n=1 Tax=Candidatus Magasanikbacteria bacterium GW2011_GWA2_56_11 TaxID=1619044 RepID=A0A0G2ANC3_9BACT|nr:MAG: hypothetical protein UY92_C0003G0053 [Candidatus Magasanikbacteria bacterium GW2011_GWA2_56_11]
MFLDASILILLIAASAFFSASEIAFVSLSNAKVDDMVRRSVPRSRLIQKLKSEPRRLLITVLIGNNLVNIGASSLATVLFARLFQSTAVGITTGIMTLAILIFGEIVPKAYATNHNKKIAALAAPILRALAWMFHPLVVIFGYLTTALAGAPKEESITENEVRALVLAGSRQGTIEKEEQAIIERLFAFNDITAEDIMTPRVNVAYIEDASTIAQAAAVIARNPHTRFPVVHETPDDIIGFVHSRDVLLALNQDRDADPVTKIVRPIIAIPKQMRLDDLMREFQKKKTHLAVVLDEFGGTEGIATLEDVIEELVGEITDEYDVDKHFIQRLDKNTIMVSGDTLIRDINHFFNIAIPGDPLDTIAEVLLDKLQVVPRPGMSVSFTEVTAAIHEVRRRTIGLVKIIKSSSV